MIRSTFTWLLVIAIQYATAVPAENSKISPVDLNYECVHQTGYGEGKAPIILLHGLGLTMRDWDGTFEALAFRTGRRTCRADLRNHGDSPWDDETNVAAMVEDTIHLLDTIGEERAVIIGHSLGGKIAMNAALNYPARVQSIVAEDMVPHGDPNDVHLTIASMRQMLGAMDRVPEGFDETLATQFVLFVFREVYQQMNMTISEEELQRSLLLFTCMGGKCRWKANLEAIVKTMETGYYSFWTPSSGVYGGPALFIYGTKSPSLVIDKEEEIRKLFPKVKFVGVEGAGHGIHRHFSQFEEEVMIFLEENNTAV